MHPEPPEVDYYELLVFLAIVLAVGMVVRMVVRMADN